MLSGTEAGIKIHCQLRDLHSLLGILKGTRERRDEARKLCWTKGVDSSKNRKTQKLAEIERVTNSSEVVAREWFAKHSHGWIPEHGHRTIRLLERDIFPWMGARPVNDTYLCNPRVGVHSRFLAEAKNPPMLSR
uniref:Phage integrase central domain-containing protein n=1 Tax=Candidatus Kentrum sp. FW TaxID=2126338 RepID=A0A450STU6_9GAMM|nr:MAG: hypothetical protein BECKFW1821B_GA0114236_103415 [Candidatus Kentron sp. FW]